MGKQLLCGLLRVTIAVVVIAVSKEVLTEKTPKIK